MQIGSATNWKEIGTGWANHIGAIKTDGTSWTWGYGAYGQLGDNTSTNRSSPGTVVGGITTWKDITTSLYQLMLISDQGGL